jgi:hypothetical protein
MASICCDEKVSIVVRPPAGSAGYPQLGRVIPYRAFKIGPQECSCEVIKVPELAGCCPLEESPPHLEIDDGAKVNHRVGRRGLRQAGYHSPILA